MIKISVIIPVYNMEDYLDECLESVMNQTLQEIEILCVNDGSTDKSCQKLMAWAKKDSRLRILNLNHQGVAAARNTAIKNAMGTFVAFMDADDKYPDDRVLEKMHDAAIRNGVKIAGGCFSNFDGSGKVNTEYEGIYSGYVFHENKVMDYRDYQFDYGYHRFIYNREFLLNHRVEFPMLVRFQDPPFMVQVMTLAGQFYAMTDITYCYRDEYKTIKWNKSRTLDLLEGLSQNLKWSKEYQLVSLRALTIQRITDEYSDIILNHFISMEILQKYTEIAEENCDSFAIRQMLSKGFMETMYRVKSSYSYRVGRLLTYIPRKIRHTYNKTIKYHKGM